MLNVWRSLVPVPALVLACYHVYNSRDKVQTMLKIDSQHSSTRMITYDNMLDVIHINKPLRCAQVACPQPSHPMITSGLHSPQVDLLL